MRIIKTNILLLAVLFILFFSKTVSGLNEDTHEAINKRVAQITLTNGFSLNDYLINQLGLKNGILEVFDNKNVWLWLQLGGRYEDVPPGSIIPLIGYTVRSRNHFHDPITDMGYHGLFFSGMSSIEWALSDAQTQGLGYYSWKDVMGYYKEALTNEDQDTRNTNFAKTFRGIGQLMHHIQDASSPAHTRNDQHPEYNYETWVRDNIDEPVISGYESIFFTGTKNSIASFIDTDQYNGTDPIITDSTDIGLSEYANANFFSNGTNAINSEDYVYPDVNVDTNTVSIVEEIFVNNRVPPAENFKRKYYKKNCCGETNDGNGYLLTATEILEYDIEDFFIDDDVPEEIKEQAPLLDHNVYSDYADLLLPRAIGYSAGLLEYFFRGEIEVVQVPNTDNIKIKNNSSEDMDGTFTLYYDAEDGNRKQVENGETNNEWSLSLQAGQTSNELSFTEPTDFDENQQYILVFKGKLGNESNTVVGNVFDCNTKGCAPTHQYRTKSQSKSGLSWQAAFDAFVAKPWSDWISVENTGQAYMYGNGFGYYAKETIETHIVLPSFPQTVNAYFNQIGGINPYAHRGHAKVEMVEDPLRFNTWKNDRPALPGDPAFSVFSGDGNTVRVYMYEVDYSFFIPSGHPQNAWRQTGWFGRTYITN